MHKIVEGDLAMTLVSTISSIIIRCSDPPPSAAISVGDCQSTIRCVDQGEPMAVLEGGDGQGADMEGIGARPLLNL